MPESKRKRPRDLNEMAKQITDEATGEASPRPERTPKDPAAVELGRRGGKARAKKLAAKKRSQIAKKGSDARWKRP